MGKLKARIFPEDVTLNMSKHAPVPPVPDLGDGKKHKWGGIEHKNTVTWHAKWKDSINGEDKCADVIEAHKRCLREEGFSV